MTHAAFFDPAVSVMNRLPFKIKIFSAISILFLLLLFPSRNVFMHYFEHENISKKQLTGLHYTIQLHKLIEATQMHRGMSNAFLNGNTNYKKELIKNEKNIDRLLQSLIEYDKTHFDLLKNDPDFVKAWSSFELLRLSNLPNRDNTTIFQKHTQIIEKYMRTLQRISRKSHFSTSENMQLNFIAQLLQEKLLLLEENLGKLRGLSTGIFENHHISSKLKRELLSIFTLVQALQNNILDDNILHKMQNYLFVQTEMVKAMDKIDKILDIVYHQILAAESPQYESQKFFSKATIALKEIDHLYNLLAGSYRQIVQQSREEISFKLYMSLLGLILILLSASYLITAFYRSISTNLEKLQRASQMIAAGETKIELVVETEDELGNALSAFNHMSQKLDENISFLDGYKMAIDETSIVTKTDPKGIITYVNKKFCEISGYTKTELLGRSHNIVRHPDMPASVFKEMWKTIREKKVWKGVIKNRKKDGSFYIVDATIIPVLDSNNDIMEYIGVRHDITELEKSKEEIKRQRVDLLTGLPNRNQLLDDLKHAEKPLLLYFNIDDFTGLNDFYGTSIGDGVLRYLSQLLKQCIEKTQYTLYKLHADEFVMMLENDIETTDYEAFMAKTIDFIEAETIDCDGQSCISITLSGGIATYQNSEHLENLISYATTARKVAKIQNKKFLHYDISLNKDADYKKNIEWINKIKEALILDRIVPYFQPIIDNRNGTITKYEALVRMIDHEGKAISPYFFLEIAKKAKLYTKITEVMLEKSFKAFEHLPQYEFSINITVEDVENEEIVASILEKLADYPRPERVIFEITESEEIKNYRSVKSFIEKIKRYGAKIAIDDFGSGYANFEHILSLKADYIKIDGSLIKNIHQDRDSQIITEAIIAFSKKMGSQTVVEYVHNEAVLRKVKALGADFSQGFYIAEPGPEKMILKELLHKETAEI